MRQQFLRLPATLILVMVMVTTAASAQQNKSQSSKPATQTTPTLVPLVTSEAEFDNQTIRSKVSVMVVFCSDSSKRCGLQMPIVEEVAKEYAGRVKFIRVDADANAMQNILISYSVPGVPTFLMFSQPCVKIKATIGGQYKAELEQAVENGLKACSVTADKAPAANHD